jgi:hypothetical protein
VVLLMSASLLAAGGVVAKQDNGSVGGLIWIAEADRIDWFDRTRRTRRLAHSRRRVRIAQGTVYSTTRRRGLLLCCAAGSHAGVKVKSALSIASFALIAIIATTITTALDGAANDTVQIGETIRRQ